MTTLDQSSANALEGLADKPKSFGRLAWERFIHHRLAILGLVGLILIALGFIVGPMINSYPFDKPDVLSRSPATSVGPSTP
jgi:oligopeptide transport system permease protein